MDFKKATKGKWTRDASSFIQRAQEVTALEIRLEELGVSISSTLTFTSHDKSTHFSRFLIFQV